MKLVVQHPAAQFKDRIQGCIAEYVYLGYTLVLHRIGIGFIVDLEFILLFIDILALKP